MGTHLQKHLNLNNYEREFKHWNKCIAILVLFVGTINLSTHLMCMIRTYYVCTFITIVPYCILDIALVVIWSDLLGNIFSWTTTLSIC